MTQEQFADRIGISQNYLSTMEPGKVEIGAEILLRISREFAKSVEWLLTREGCIPFTVTDRALSVIAWFRKLTCSFRFAQSGCNSMPARAMLVAELLFNEYPTHRVLFGAVTALNESGSLGSPKTPGNPKIQRVYTRNPRIGVAPQPNSREYFLGC